MNKQAITQNIDAILETARRIKGCATTANVKAKRIDEKRQKVRDLQAEAHAATGAMVDGTTDEHRDLAVISKELKAANNALDRAIEASHEGNDDLDELLNQLNDLIDYRESQTIRDLEQAA